MIATRWNPLGKSGAKPYAYEVEYLESTGTQYIDSGVECTGDLSVEFATMVLTYANLACCGGIHVTSPYFRHHCTVYNEATYWLQHDSSDGASISASIDPNVKIEISVDAVNGTALVNGEEYLFDPVDATKTTGRSYGIFARIANDGSIQSRPSRFWFFKMSRGGVLLRDFIPVVDRDGVACMYDKVTKQFFYNQGTGEFTAGPMIVPVGNVSAKFYIQDGLIHMWDGIENAGYGKRDNNATVWKDLAGNIDLTLTGETAWSDIAFQLNGAGGAVGAIESAVETSVKTLEVAFKCSVDSSSYKTLAIVGGTWNSMSLLVHGNWVEGVSSPSYRRTDRAYFGTTRHLTRFRDSVARNILVNGAEVASDNGNWFGADDPGTVSIGKNGSRYYYYGDIYAVRCYTRVLTIDEVNQNYAIDKERFGLQ